jgi:dsRNA-specific ribonuclease
VKTTENINIKANDNIEVNINVCDEQNWCGMLMEYAQKAKMRKKVTHNNPKMTSDCHDESVESPIYEFTDTRNASDNTLTFKCTCKYDGLVADGFSNYKKGAKQAASKKILQFIKELS